jgi:pimeloyl-ACP methyl ester carboxylesterase
MPTFVLVHGAWQSTGTWDRLVPLLEEQGHRAVTPVLSGLGTDQARLSTETTLHQHIEDVSNVLSGLEEVTLVGHSYAGMIVSGVVEAQPTKVQRLVFMDAFIPENGQCVLDLLPSEIGAHFRQVAQSRGNGWRLPGGEDQLDLRCFEERILLPANRKASVSATYIACVAENYPARPFFKIFADRARACGWDIAELNTGHDCHVERPHEVANILLAAPQRGTASSR